MEMKWFNEWHPAVAMLVVNVALGFMNTLVKKAIGEGMNCLVIITLRQFVATVLMTPIAYCRERGCRPKLTLGICVYLFFSALLGATLTQYLFFVGLQYTSATFACAFLNMTPVITFLIALAFRLEMLNLRSMAGQAKVLGTILCVGGAMILTFYKGIALTHSSTTELRYNSTMNDELSPTPAGAATAQYWSGKTTIGTVALFGGCLSWSSWFLLQSRVNKKYPALYSGTAIIFFLSFLQSLALTFATHNGFSLLTLRGKLQIITVLFAGIVGSGMGFLIMSWCVRKRGPVFPAAFSPLIQLVVAIIDFFVLHEQLHLGSVLGSVLVILGLYALLWGKNREEPTCEVKQVQGSQENEGTNKEPV